MCVRASPCVGFFVWTAAKGKFLTTDNWRKWGYLCLFEMCCFKKWCQIYRLVGKVYLGKRQSQKFWGLSFVFDVDYMERKEYA